MLTPEEVAGFHFLSLSPNQSENYQILKSAFEFISHPAQADRYNYYLQVFESVGTFPSFEIFLQSLGDSAPDCSALTLDYSSKVFHQYLKVQEIDFINREMLKAPYIKKRELVARLTELVSDVSTEDVSLNSSSSASTSKFLIQEGESRDGLKWFLHHLNEFAPLRPGMMIAFLGTPGSGKTQSSLNMVAVNCLDAGKKRNALYVYGENTESVYMAELLSRFSYNCGMNIENTSLRAGVFADDQNATSKIQELTDKFHALDHGQVYFLPMGDLPREPSEIGTFLAGIINKYHIDMVVIDHLQIFQVFCPPKSSKLDYLNSISSQLRNVAIGQNGSPPVLMIVLSQVNRESQAKSNKSEKLTLGSSYMCSSIEQDAFVIVGLTASPETKQASLIKVQLLKNRERPVDISPVMCPVLFPYCFMGDLSEEPGSSDIFNTESMDSLFN